MRVQRRRQMLAGALTVVLAAATAAAAAGAARPRSGTSVTRAPASAPASATAARLVARSSDARTVTVIRTVPVHFWHGPWYWGYPYWAGGPYAYGVGRSEMYAAQGMGALDLNVRPRDAEVHVDGQPVGKARKYDGLPGYLWLEKGIHEIAFSKPGYETVERRIKVFPGLELDVDVTLPAG